MKNITESNQMELSQLNYHHVTTQGGGKSVRRCLKQKENKLRANGINYMRRIVKYAMLDHKSYHNILEELCVYNH